MLKHDDRLYCEVLGALAARRGPVRIELGWARQQAVLAVLLTRMNQPVPVEALIEAVWADNPPQGARNTVQTNISRLRRALRPAGATDDRDAVVVRTEAGYLLRGEPDQLDALVFEQEVAAAQEHQRAGQWRAAAESVGSALRRWRGEPFSGLDSPYLHAHRLRLRECHLLAQELSAALALDRGEHRTAVAELTALVTRHPLRERLRELLMLALYRSGRQAEALGVFQDARVVLAEQLGIDPGPAMRGLHQRILTRDPELSAPPRLAGPPVVLAPAVTVEQLPADPLSCTGREEELRRLTEPSAAVVVHVVDGMPGIGKTTLAVRAANLLAADYPDGRIFLRLNAFAAAQPPLPPYQALAALLLAVGVPAAALPETEHARAALWRERLRDKRLLLILDDAAGHEQVRPLLPGPGRCRVLITSRRRLSALEGVRSLELNPLPLEQAARLFQRLAGPREQPVDPAAVNELVALCGGLPLAITLLAGRLRHHPRWTERYLVDLLSSARTRLSELHAENRTLTAAFELSYQGLPVETQRLFRCLGLCSGVEVDPPHTAALAGLTAAAARRGLELLYDNHLLTESAPGRYVLHELVKEYAATLAELEDPTLIQRAG
ncbi:NB-ARC domain-containing protein [Crossiella sp. SN42]|uniref:AfsR/SARP family transcriptional regulator n=1 Tax=Crossiella sp. SN42 TaxID=2944808 RepID=UPI00207D0720|nr:AfsR/SARP family transcriptional regulator [Crossiella sp. SN42]MCO1574678.1 NB-ARC domain-containing protein [Crossiella sp. SN42]